MNEHVIAGAMFLGGYALIGLSASAALWAVSRLASARLDRLPAAAQARVMVAAAVAPAFVAFAAACGSVAHFEAAGPMTFCRSIESIARTPSVLLSAALSLVVVRAAWSIWRAIRCAISLARLRRAFPATRRLARDVRVTDSSVPHAFVMGMLSPRVYVTSRLIDEANGEELRLILEHERSHVRRRDPLRRLVASLASVLHWPHAARAIETRLVRAQEAAADDDAARSTADRLKLAETMIAFARGLRPFGSPVYEFAEGNLDYRVRRLLQGPASEGGPSFAVLSLCAAAVMASALVFGGALHWLVQAAIRLP